MSIREQLRNRTELLTINQLAELLILHPQTLYTSCRRGLTPHLRLGGRIKFDPASIADFFEKRTIG